MLTSILIDDEPHALKALQNYIEHVPNMEVIGAYHNPLEALKAIQQRDMVDLVLLDVNMPELSGLDLARLIRNQTRKLVFTTGHSKYAYEAFEVKADAYLLKPYSLTKFLETIQQLDFKLVPPEEFFFVKSKEDGLKMVKLYYRDITAVESKLNYIKISTLDKQVTTYMSLTEMVKILSFKPGFMQVHRSFIIQMDKIKTLDGNTLELNDGQKITVGEHYRKPFQDFLNSKVIKAGITISQP
ncbi:MAG: hypothetical protein RLZ47_317 [Bacteroidota bacterium]|jgi:DNA-binding LytR/AlgR family response regulator